MKSLKNIVKQLREAAKDVQKEPGEDSLDDQIDKYLVSYEKEAKRSKTEALDFRSITRRFLVEIEEEEGKDEEAKKGKKEDEENKASSPKKLKTENINMGSFVSDVMRLVDNYDSLLEVRNTILRRSINFLEKNYEGDVADAFKEELLESYGIEIGRSEIDKSEEFAAPKAGAAGPMGGGA